MRVYTFYERMFDDESNLVTYWKRSWENAGWEPEVLTLSHAKCDYDYEKFVQATKKLPTINHKLFEEMCYVRWAALRYVGGGLLTDYDVMNYSFPPTKPKTDLEMYGGYWGCVWATEQGVTNFIDEISNNGESYIKIVNDRPHISDARIGYHFPKTQKRREIRHLMAQDIQSGKKEAIRPLLVHYSNNWWKQNFNKGSKVKSIKMFEEKYEL